MDRPSCLALLAALGLIFGQPHNGAAQSPGPPMPDGPSPFVAAPADAGTACAAICEPACPPSPWYAGAEFAVLFNTAVSFNDHVYSVTDHNSVFVSPRAYLGYRFEGGGSVRFTYRNLTEVGYLGPHDSEPAGWSSGHTFTTNWFDLDYVTREFAPLDWWRLQLEAGGRLVYRYQGWNYDDPYAHSEDRQNFFAGGPHFGLTTQVLFGGSGWALYGRADTAVTFGGDWTTSRFTPKLTYAAWYGDSPRSTSSSTDAAQFDLGLQLGLLKHWQLARYSIGLGFGVQMDVLTMGVRNDGRFDSFGLVNVGPFLRCEVGF